MRNRTLLIPFVLAALVLWWAVPPAVAATRTYTRPSAVTCDPVQLGALIDTATGLSGSTVEIEGLTVRVTHANITSGHDAAVDAQVSAYAYDPIYQPTAVLATIPATANTARLAADHAAITTTTYASVSGLSLPLAPNRNYGFQFFVLFQSAATTTGIGLSVTGPASPALIVGQTLIPTSLTAATQGAFIAYGGGNATSGIDAANATRQGRLWGTISTGAAGGSLILQVRSEIAASAVTVKAGSWAVLTPLP